MYVCVCLANVAIHICLFEVMGIPIHHNIIVITNV